MAASLLRRGGNDWDVFRSWELEVYRNTKPATIPVIALFTELRVEWRNVVDKASYSKSLRNLKASTEDLEFDSTRARIRRVTLENIRARDAKWMLRRNPLRAYERLVESLDQYIERLRDHVRCLRAVQREQKMVNLIGKVAGNERSRKYTTKLLHDTKASIDDVKAQLAEFRSWLGVSSTLQSTKSDRVPSEPLDEHDGGKGGKGKGRSSSEAVSGANGPIQAASADVSATGGAVGGGGGAGDGSGGASDGEGDGRRLPASKVSVEEDEEEAEEGNEAEVLNDEDAQRTAEDPEPIHEHKVGSGNGDTFRVAGSSPARRLSDEDGPSLLDILQADLDQSAADLGHHVPPAASKHSSLPDFTDYDVADAQVAVSQHPGASRDGNEPSARYELRFRHREQVDRQGHEADRGPATAAGGPGDPDGNSDESDDDKDLPKDPPQVPPRGLSKGKGKRSNYDDSANNRNNSKRRKHNKVDDALAISPDVPAPSPGLSPEAMQYLHAAQQPDCPVMLSPRTLIAFVNKLDEVFGTDEWFFVRPLQEYFNEDGTERHGEAWQDLRRRDFDKRWDVVFSHIVPEEKSSYAEQHVRLIRAEAWDVVPEPGFGRQHHDLDRLKRLVIEAENAEMHQRWKLHEAHMRRNFGSDAAEEVRSGWLDMVDRILVYGGDMNSPLPTPSLGPTDGPLVADIAHHPDPELLEKKARKLGFEERNGVWSFMASLGTGGYGRKLSNLPVTLWTIS